MPSSIIMGLNQIKKSGRICATNTMLDIKSKSAGYAKVLSYAE